MITLRRNFAMYRSIQFINYEMIYSHINYIIKTVVNYILNEHYRTFRMPRRVVQKHLSTQTCEYTEVIEKYIYNI